MSITDHNTEINSVYNDTETENREKQQIFTKQKLEAENLSFLLKKKKTKRLFDNQSCCVSCTGFS